MSWKEWKNDLDKANRDYDAKRIDQATYITRIKYDICMISKEGNHEMAEGIAKAHAYDIKELLNEHGR